MRTTIVLLVMACLQFTDGPKSDARRDNATEFMIIALTCAVFGDMFSAWVAWRRMRAEEKR